MTDAPGAGRAVGTIIRGMVRVTKTPWFGPRRWGWGWSPVSWQGWVVTIAFAVVGQVLKDRVPPRKAAVITLGIVSAFLGVVVITGDPPGHRPRSAPSLESSESPPSREPDRR